LKLFESDFTVVYIKSNILCSHPVVPRNDISVLHRYALY